MSNKYAHRMLRQRSSTITRHVARYLRENQLLAVPFDKGNGVCVMRVSEYLERLRAVLGGNQFKVAVGRASDLYLNEEIVFNKKLAALIKKNKISSEIARGLRPTGTTPPRLYGLAKVHKVGTPLRPIVSMCGSVYHPLAKQLNVWLKRIPESRIQSSSSEIAQALSGLTLEEGDCIYSLDVVSLYTRVPLVKTVDLAVQLAFESDCPPPVDRETFRTLLLMCTQNVLFLSHDGFVRQTDGVAMGSPLGPSLANIYMSQFDGRLGAETKLYRRYMDDCLLIGGSPTVKLAMGNKLDPTNLEFTVEHESVGHIGSSGFSSLPFLDILIRHEPQTISSAWFRKVTDTGLLLSADSLAPRSFKRGMVLGGFHRIFNVSSSEDLFLEGVERYSETLRSNGYLQSEIDLWFRDFLESKRPPTGQDSEGDDRSESDDVISIKVQYRGRETDKFIRALRKCVPRGLNVRFVQFTRKLSSSLPSLKPRLGPQYVSGVIYKISCAACLAAYVGCTKRHLFTRVSEHQKPKSNVAGHFADCGARLNLYQSVKVLCRSNNPVRLFTLEALYIRWLNPLINVQVGAGATRGLKVLNPIRPKIHERSLHPL